MQTHGGAPAAEAIETTGGKRYFRAQLLVDWNRDEQFDHELSDLGPLLMEASLGRSLAGTAPAEVMIVEGQAAAEMTITLEGEHNGLNAAALFSEYNGNSPLYNVDPQGCQITYQIGVDTSVGTVWYPQFVGFIRRVKPSRARSHQVVLTAVDRAELMRQPVSLPVWAITRWHSIRGYVRAQLCYSHWVIDACLRTGDASTTPYRYITATEGAGFTGGMWGLQFWLSGNGAWIPNVGTLDNARVQGFPKPEVGGAVMHTRLGEAHPDVKSEVEASGKRPYSLSPTTTDSTGVVPALESSDGTDRRKSFYLAYRAARPNEVQNDNEGTHLFGFTLITRGDGDYYQTADVAHMEVYVGHLYVCRIRFQAGWVRGELYRWDSSTIIATTSWVLIPTDRDSVQIEAQFAGLFGPDRRGGIRADENISSYASLGSYPGSFDYDTREGLVIVRHQVAMQDVYWVNRSTVFGDFVVSRFETYARREATYAAVLDEGLNKLTLMPNSSYEDAWELAGAVAAAEMGAVFWDEAGVFRFWNRDTIVAKQNTVVRSLTLDDVAELGIESSLDSIRNIVTAEALLANSDQAVIFEANDNEEFYVPSTTVVTRIVPASNDVMAVQPGFVTRYSTDPGNSQGHPVWTANTQHGYVVQWFNGSSWVEMDNRVSGVDILAYSDGQGNTTLHIWNGYGDPARFSDNAGNARLRVTGTTVIRSDSVTTTWRDQESVDKFGPRNLPLSGDWVQNQPTSIARLGTFVLSRTVQSIPTTDDIPIPGDPRLQIGDCIEMKDPDGLGEVLLLQVLGYKRVWSRSRGLTDHLTVELIRRAQIGLWDSEQYGRWDETMIWS
jgi:hypothetical protein